MIELIMRRPILLLIVLGGCLSSAANAQVSNVLSFDLHRRLQAEGESRFDLSLSSYFANDEITMPDGVVLKTSHLSLGSRTFETFDDLRAAMAGTWTVDIPSWPTNGDTRERYAFTVSDFPESAVFEAPPEITYPLDGAIVPSEFTMTWEWPPDVTPSEGYSTMVRRFGPGNRTGQRITGKSGGSELSAIVSAVSGTGEIAERLTLWAGGFKLDVLEPYLSEVTPLQATASYQYSLQSYSRSFSQPVDVFVRVPECSTLVLVAFGMGTLLLRGRICRLARLEAVRR